MALSEYFPIWDKLTPEEQRTLENSVTERSAPAGTVSPVYTPFPVTKLIASFFRTPVLT